MNNPIRVLHIVTILNRGGLETMIMNHYRRIDRSKIQFDFLVHREGIHDYTNEVLKLGGRIYTVPSFNPLNTNGYLTKLEKFFSDHTEYKIIHSHLDTLSTYPLKYAKKYNAPIRIAHAHTSNLDKDWKYPIRILSKMKIHKYATTLIACGKKAGDWMYKRKEYSIINNAIDLNDYAFDISKRKLYRDKYNVEDKIVIGQVGRFIDTKNHIFSLKLLKELVDFNNNYVMMFVGEGELRDSIQKHALEMGIMNNVVFTGLVNNVNELLNAMDIFIMPSKYEGVPLSLIEAQANGMPIIASDKVSKEVKITKLVNFIGINEQDIDQWKDMIIKLSHEDRVDYSNSIRDNGYDVNENITKLYNIYQI